jgi:hypothetical protein
MPDGPHYGTSAGGKTWFPPHSRRGQYFLILPAHQGKAEPISDLNAFSSSNRPSCESHREGSNNGYYGRQGV